MKINLAPSVKKEMLKAEFWLTNSAAESTLNYREIEEINHKTALKAEKNNFTDYYFNLESAPESYQKSELKEMIKNTFIRKIDPKKEYYNLRAELLPQKTKEEIITNCNLNSVREDNQVQSGILIRRSVVRALPTEEVFASEKFSGDQDLLQLTALSLGTPLLILFESSDQKYFYIKAKLMTGWVKKENIALTEDLKTARNYLNTNQFLVVRESYLETEPNPFAPETSHLFFQMGDKIPLVKDQSLTEIPASHPHAQANLNNYLVWLPTKDDQGYLELKQGIIASARDLNPGFLKFNQQNIIKQAFKMLGERYDWGGAVKRRDCSRFIMDIFRTFGFEFPRNADLQKKLIPFEKEIFRGDLKARKMILKKLKTGDILHMPGHVMLYLGESEGKNYLIHAASGYGELDQNGKLQTRSVRSVFLMDLEQFIKNKQLSYLEKFSAATKITS
ncbi:cell wall-associated NlpC family hydrolase [Halanaerobium saccharolyticum]|uniref:Cell wall-associated NlpC family hydrolase n=1 Tax=Halanaerobium saccharolyticum TaxID=43595 RepID=A0A4V3CY11_9FIRM|nr:NlpC/P60 family protein [Halanaerobium saccharolyticum]TDP92258.1 cell wall-associated NlpC family hydrolase [Halanaerobium saccharolyticum]